MNLLSPMPGTLNSPDGRCFITRAINDTHFAITLDGGWFMSTPTLDDWVLDCLNRALDRPPVICPDCGEWDNSNIECDDADCLRCLCGFYWDPELGLEILPGYARYGPLPSTQRA